MQFEQQRTTHNGFHKTHIRHTSGKYKSFIFIFHLLSSVVYTCLFVQMSISLSCCKYPPADSIPIIWRENLQPLVDLVQSLASGIRATVADEYGNPLRKATVKIQEKTYGVSQNMAYFKITLVPGEYTLTVSCEGYNTQILRVPVQRQNVTNIDIKMMVRRDNHREEPLEKLNFVNRALVDLHAKYPRETTLHTIGKTTRGSEIRCLEIGNFDDGEHAGRPAIVFSAGMLRSEPVTSGVLLHFASYLLDNYKRNASIVRRYLNDFSVYVAPDFSPDFNETLTCSPQTDGLQFPVHDKLGNEAAMIANWFKDLNAVLAVNLNSGSRHIEIPFGGDYGETRERKYESADEDLLRHLASTYAEARANKLSAKCGNSNIDDNSVIHAALGIGGRRGHPLLDYIYFNTSTLMMDVYVACCTTDHSVAVWQENEASLLACMREMSNNVRGYIINEDGEPIEDAVLSYDKSPRIIKNDKSGFYSILLLPGSHNITATAPGYLKLVSIYSFETHKLSLMFKLTRDDNIMGMPRLVFIMMTGESRDI